MLDSNDPDVCCLCLDSFEQPGLSPQTLPCGHKMHAACIAEMRRRCAGEGKCPMCRANHEELEPLDDMCKRAGLQFLRKSYVEAHRTLEQMIEIDSCHPKANMMLGEIYHHGYAVVADAKRACAYYKAAHEAGCAYGTTNFGVMLDEFGDKMKAEELWTQAHLAGDALATNKLGVLHDERGDLRMAEKYYWQAHLAGSAIASTNLGKLLLERGDRTGAIRLWKHAHLAGDVEATNNLGAHYLQTDDLARAAPLLEEAHRRGCYLGTNNLGDLYDKQGDVRKAEQFWTQAYRMGNAEERAEPSNSLAALCMDRGNEMHAEALFSEAHGLGCVKATVNLGKLYMLRGEIGKAHGLFEDARQKGDAEAADILQDNCFRNRPKQTRSDLKGATSGIAKTVVQNGIQLGNHVRIGGLTSEAGQRLNGLSGIVRSFDRTSSRFGVEVLGIGSKALKEVNLTRVTGGTA